MSSLERIIYEYKDLVINPDPNCGILVSLENENDYRLWKVSLFGPKDTSYSKGLFFMNVKFPDEYPIKPPEVCFLTPVYHLNINDKAPKSPNDIPLGKVSISTLNWWKSEYSMRELLIKIFVLFYNGNPDNCFDLDKAEEFCENRAVYEEKIKHFTKKYANPSKPQIKYDINKDWDFEL